MREYNHLLKPDLRPERRKPAKKLVVNRVNLLPLPGQDSTSQRENANVTSLFWRGQLGYGVLVADGRGRGLAKATSRRLKWPYDQDTEQVSLPSQAPLQRRQGAHARHPPLCARHRGTIPSREDRSLRLPRLPHAARG